MYICIYNNFFIYNCIYLYVLYTVCLFIQGTWLYDKYGLSMKIIWGVGILAAGQSSTMTVRYFMYKFVRDHILFKKQHNTISFDRV